MKIVYTFFTALACVIIQQSYASEEASEDAIYQLLRDFWSLMSDAEMQEKDALYPITRYAGMGYNYLQGNPEGDFNIGRKDPGIKSTRCTGPKLRFPTCSVFQNVIFPHINYT